MLINIDFGFIMFIVSLINLPIAKRPMWQKHNIHLANFDLSSLRVIWFRWAAFGLPAHRNEQRRERPKLPRQMSPNETGDCSFVRFSEIALVSMHFDHVASIIINADHSGV